MSSSGVELCTVSAGGLLQARLAAVAAVLFATALALWPATVAFAALWSDTGQRAYTHGFLILITALWLIWRDRARLEAVALKPVPGALVAVLLASAAWLIFWRAGIRDLYLFAVPVVLLAALAASFGWAVLRVLAFPIGFLYFAMPLWGELVRILQPLSVKAIDALIFLTGLPAYMDGDVVRLPAGVLVIADGCSGLHFMIVGLAMAALYGELSRDPLRRRVLWLAWMGGLALLANWIRIFIIVVLAYLTDMRTSLVRDHYWFGWCLFGLAFTGFLWMAGRRSAAPAREGALSSVAPAAAAVSPGALTASLVCIAALPGLAYGSDLWRGIPGVVSIEWPRARGAWSGPHEVVAQAWRPVFVNASAADLRQYAQPNGHSVQLFTVAYRTQRYGMKLVSFDNSIIGKGSEQLGADKPVVTTASGVWLEKTVIDHAARRSIIWLQYRIGNRSFARPQLAQVWYGIRALTEQPLSYLIALRADCDSGCDAARERLESAADLLQPSVRLGRQGS